MSVKASIIKPRTQTQVIDVDTAEGADQLAKELGIESVTTVGTGEGAQTIDVATIETEQRQQQAQAVAVRQTQAVNPYTASSNGGLEGEYDASDLTMPQLKIVNGSGELSQRYNQGSLIFGDNLIWSPPNLQPGAKNPVLTFIPLKVKKQFRENLTQEEVQEGLLPRVVNSRAEAEAMSGSDTATQWVGNQKPRWSPSAFCIFLIAQPEHQDSENPVEFTQTLDDRNWALCRYYAGGMAYNESAKVILSNAYTVLRVNGRITLHKRLWTFQVAKKKAGNFGVYVPVLRLSKEETGPDATAFIQDMIGSQAAE